MTTKITFETNTELDDNQIVQAHEIFKALIKSGGMFGVRGGKTILHFDQNGLFMGVSCDYMIWKRRKEVDK